MANIICECGREKQERAGCWVCPYDGRITYKENSAKFRDLEVGELYYSDNDAPHELRLRVKVLDEWGMNSRLADAESDKLTHGCGPLAGVVRADDIEPEFLAASQSAVESKAIGGIELIENPVDEKLRELVSVDWAPQAGDFKIQNDHVYICTGSGKQWYCHDNSAGDPTLEGGYVCYAYYVLANDEQIAEYNRQQQAIAEKRSAQKREAEIKKHVRENGERVDGVSGEEIRDNRQYHLGVGYGTGEIWYADGDTLYLSVDHASEVSDWRWSHYRLNDAAELIIEIKQF